MATAPENDTTLKSNLENLPCKRNELTQQETSQLNKERGDEDNPNLCYRCGYWLEDSSICCFLGPGTPVRGPHTLTHVIYILLLACSTLLSSLSFVPKVNDTINSIREFCGGSLLPSACDSLVPYLFIYRIGLIMAGFYVTMLILLCGVSSAENTRAQFHSAFWLQKLSLLVLIGLGTYFIPRGIFEVIWFSIGLTGSFFTLLIQLVLIIDLSHACNELLDKKRENGYSRISHAMKVFTISILYFTSAVTVFCLYFVFSKSDDCKTNNVLITVNVILCIIVSVISMLPKVHRSCLLQAAAVTTYTVYLTYGALAYETQLCEPLGELVLNGKPNQSINAQSLIAVVILFVLLTYAFLRKSKQFYLRFGSLVLSRGNEQKFGQNHPLVSSTYHEETGGNEDDASEAVQDSYSYSFIYLVFLLASLHIMVSLTNYYSLNSDAYYWQLTTNWGALYMKTLVSTLVVVLFMWKVCVRLLYPEQDTRQIHVLAKTLIKFIFKALFTLLFKACPFRNQSKSTRFVYTFFLLAGTAISGIMYIPGMRAKLESNPYFCNRISKLGNCLSMDPAYLAVYRICFAMAAFFFLFAIILYSVDYYSDPRALIHNGLWVVKFGLFFGLVLFTFFIPLEFSRIWMYIALLGTFVFVTMQLFFLLDFTKRWNNSWASKAQATGQKRWFYGIVAVTVFLYILSAVALIVFYFLFTHSKHCRTNKMFTTMNLVLCIIATLISIHPKVYECGLLQSSVATAYTTYLTWSAISYNPNEKCNPVAAYVSDVDMRPSLNVQASIDLLLMVAAIIYFSVYTIPLTKTARQIAKTYASFVCRFKKSNKRDESLVQNPSEVSPLRQTAGSPESEDHDSSILGLRGSNSDKDKVPYSYSCYHVVYLMASLHVTMILTNWYSPKDSSHIKLIINWAAMCIKMTSSCFCMLLYIWSLVVPLLLENREKNTI